MGGHDPAPVLFLCLFAAQAAVLVLSPILPVVARDLGVSTATAGQLRAISGLVAGALALGVAPIAGRVGLRDLILGGLTLLAMGALASAAAPTFATLAAAQAVIGAGLALVLSAGVAAADAWSSPEGRARVLSWALVGQPAAWVVGMPIVGLVVRLGWRYTWLALPLAAALVALVATSGRRRDRPMAVGGGWWSVLRRERDVRVWAVGELLAYSAWSGTLVFAGALLIESYGSSPVVASIVLATAAAAYLPGNFLARRRVERAARPLIVSLALVAATLALVLGGVRPSLWWSAAVLAALGFVNGGRTLAGAAFGLDAGGERKIAVTSVRSAALQLGYLGGAGLGGTALAAGGYAALGAMLGALFLLAGLVHVPSLVRGRRPLGSVAPLDDGALGR